VEGRIRRPSPQVVSASLGKEACDGTQMDGVWWATSRRDEARHQEKMVRPNHLHSCLVWTGGMGRTPQEVLRETLER
jgi:hypothetical protein